MPEAPYQLDLRRAQMVLIAIRETCRYRDWDLIAAHIRTTHIHLIVDRLENPDRTIWQLKSYARRMLNLSGLEPPDRKRWARGGSTRPLRCASAVIAATIKYIVDEQGELMAVDLMDKCEPVV